jgi:FAD:protein FMN transferase
MNTRLLRRSFHAMGTSCSVWVTAGPGEARRARRALEAAEEEIDACEHELSRFRESSDLSRLNREAGKWTRVGRRLLAALEAALRARENSEGRFDPTILRALEAAGYDRSYELLEERPARRAEGWQPGSLVELDAPGGRARIARGAAVDLGGIGKGFSATQALEWMKATWPGIPGAFVDLGGDLAFHGAPPDDTAWRVAIADPRTGRGRVGILRLTGGGVATSGRDCRRFGPGRTLHHLIDPTTGVPAVGGPLAVTVVADDAAVAESHSTALAVTPVAQIRPYVDERPTLAALVVPRSGAPFAVGDLPLAA